MSRSRKDRRKKRARPPSGTGHTAHAGRGKRSSYAGRTDRPRVKGDGASVSQLRAMWPVLRLVVLFGLFIGTFYACYVPATQTEVFASYLGGLAEVCGAALRLLGHDVTVTDRLVVSPRFAFQIVHGCDGLEMVALFVASALVSPVPLRSRGLFALAGAIVLLALNVVRIVSMAYVDTYFPTWSDTVHWDVWPGVLIMGIVVSWFIWARRAARTADRNADAPV